MIAADIARQLRAQADALVIQAEILRAQAAALEAPVALSQPDRSAALSRIVNKDEMARELSVSRGQVDRLVRAGKIPCVIVGDVRRFDVAAVRAALEVHVPVPEAAPLALLAPADPAPAPSGVRLLSRPRASADVERAPARRAARR